MVRINDLPKALIATVIAVELFVHLLPSISKETPDWIVFSVFVLSFAVAWLVTTGMFKAVLWVLRRRGESPHSWLLFAARLKRLRKKSVRRGKATTGAEARIDSVRFTRP